MDPHMMVVHPSSRQWAIERLHEWFKCHQCGSITQPFRIRHNEKGTENTMACGCITWGSLYYPNRQVVKVKQGGHPIESFLSFESDTEHMTQWGRSFLVNYYKLLNCTEGFQTNTGNASLGTLTATDTGNVSRTLALSSGSQQNIFAMMNVAANNTYGMQVGTDSTANTATQIALNTLIANGVAATQLNYGAMGITVPSGSAPLSMTFTRTLTNNSGSTITINEAGLAVGTLDSGSAARQYLVIRDTTGGVAVLNGANTTGTYTLSYTIS